MTPRVSVEDSTRLGVRFHPMPTVLRIGPYRFFFVSLDRGEPPYMCGEDGSEILARPVALQQAGGFNRGSLM